MHAYVHTHKHAHIHYTYIRTTYVRIYTCHMHTEYLYAGHMNKQCMLTDPTAITSEAFLSVTKLLTIARTDGSMTYEQTNDRAGMMKAKAYKISILLL